MIYRMLIAGAAGALLAACGQGDGDDDAVEAAGAAPAAEAPAPAPAAPPDPGRDVADSFLAELNAMAAMIESVQTEADAQRAAEEIDAAAARLQAVGDANEDFLQGPQGMAMFLNRSGDFIEAQTRLGAALNTLQTEHPDLADTVNAAMGDVQMPGQ